MVVALQHVPWETMGILETALARAGRSFRYVKPYAGERVPATAEDIEALVVMGGPMSVYEQSRYPYLKQETALIRSALEQSKPVLGVCLGSQLLALALGARVGPAPKKEIGWAPLRIRPEGREDPLLSAVPEDLPVFHWHGDVFSLPRGAVSLAGSDQSEHQIFRAGDNVYGSLCHLEVTSAIVEAMVREFEQEWRRAGVDGAAILRDTGRLLPALNEHGKRLFETWVNVWARGPRQGKADAADHRA